MLTLLYLLTFYDSLVTGPITEFGWYGLMVLNCVYLTGVTFVGVLRWKKMTKKERLRVFFWILFG